MAGGRHSGSAFELNKDKMMTIKYTLALDGCSSVICYFIHNNPKTCKNGKRWNEKGAMGPWGNTGEVEYHCFGGNSDQ
jgi:hypothetical protein